MDGSKVVKRFMKAGGMHTKGTFASRDSASAERTRDGERVCKAAKQRGACKDRRTQAETPAFPIEAIVLGLMTESPVVKMLC